MKNDLLGPLADFKAQYVDVIQKGEASYRHCPALDYLPADLPMICMDL